MRYLCNIILISVVGLSNVVGQTNKKIELIRSFGHESFGPTEFGGMPKFNYSFAYEGEVHLTKLSYFGNNLKDILEPNLTAVNQMKIYSGKRIGTILGGIGFLFFTILSSTTGMEKTGETTTRPDLHGGLETTQNKRLTSVGYTLLGFAGASGISGLYCHFSRGFNLRKAIRIHNKNVNDIINEKNY